MAPQFQKGVGEFRPYTSSFREMAIRAMEETLHQRLPDRGWDELLEVFERPDVKAAEDVILRALAEMFAPKPEVPRRRAKPKKAPKRKK